MILAACGDQFINTKLIVDMLSLRMLNKSQQRQ